MNTWRSLHAAAVDLNDRLSAARRSLERVAALDRRRPGPNEAHALTNASHVEDRVRATRYWLSYLITAEPIHPPDKLAGLYLQNLTIDVAAALAAVTVLTQTVEESAKKPARAKKTRTRAAI